MSIAKDSFALTISKAIRAIGALALIMILSRVLKDRALGTYRQMLMISDLFISVVPFGIPISISYYYQNIDNDKKNNLISNTLSIMIIMSAVVAAGLYLFRYDIGSQFNNRDLGKYAYILALYVFVLIFSSFIENLYVSSNNSLVISRISVIYYLIYYIIICILAFGTKNVEEIFIVMFILEFIKATILLFIILKRINFSFGLDFKFMKKQITFSIPLGLGMLVQTVNIYISGFIVSSFLTPEKYAVYSNGSMDIPIIGIITVSVATVILPIMAKAYNTDNNINEVFDVWRNSIEKVAMVIFPIFFILLMNGKGYIIFIFSSAYLPSYSIFIIYLFKLPLMITVYGNLLIVFNKQKYILYNMLVAVILNSVLNYVSIKYLSIEAVAVSSTFVFIVLVILQLYQISKFSGKNLIKLLSYRKLIKLFMIPGITTTIVYFISIKVSFGYVLNLFIYGVIIYGVSILVYYKLGYIDKNNLIIGSQVNGLKKC